MTPVYPKVNDGIYALWNTESGKYTGTYSVTLQADGFYSLVDESMNAKNGTLLCNQDGSYTLNAADGTKDTFIFEPALVYHPEVPT